MITKLFSHIASALTTPKNQSRVQAEKMLMRGNQLEDEEDYEAALAEYRRAIDVAPTLPRAHLNEGNALLALQRPEQAAHSYREALKLCPEYAHAHFNLGHALRAQGSTEAAITEYRAALAHDPQIAEANLAIGDCYESVGKSDEAIVWCEAALRARPEYEEALYTLVRLLQDKKRFADAIRVLEHAPPKVKDASHARKLLARTYVSQASIKSSDLDGTDLGEAEALCRKALALDPKLVDAQFSIARLLEMSGKLAEAETFYLEALAINPQHAESYTGLGNIQLARGSLAKAEELYLKATALRPNMPETLNNLGNIRMRVRDLTHAERYYKLALGAATDQAPMLYNYAMLLLLRGDYEQGLRYYEKRLECGKGTTGGTTLWHQLRNRPQWHGEELAGKRLMVWTEQGLGDNLMMMRYLPELKRKGATRVIVYCEPEMARLMAQLPELDRIVSKEQPLPYEDFDLHCPTMSLPLLFNTRLASIPNQTPYVSIPVGLREYWRTRVLGIRKPVVGLAWAGSNLLPDNARRSISLHRFGPLLGLTGIQFVSLQKGGERQEIHEFGKNVLDWMDDCRDLLDTAALVDNLDLVISVDTAVAHLAGALAKPIWLLNRFESEWRWGITRDDTPWYPSMRIFNQTDSGKWDSVIERIAVELEKTARVSDARSNHGLTQ